MFSKACEYGIKAVIYIATRSIKGERVKIPDIVENCESPVAFTAKILGALTKHGIIRSQTGPNGGFYIETDRLQQIRLLDIVSAIDGDTLFKGCGLGLKECSADQPCPMHEKFVTVRGELLLMLRSTTVFDLATGITSGTTFLIR